MVRSVLLLWSLWEIGQSGLSSCCIYIQGTSLAGTVAGLAGLGYQSNGEAAGPTGLAGSTDLTGPAGQPFRCYGNLAGLLASPAGQRSSLDKTVLL